MSKHLSVFNAKNIFFFEGITGCGKSTIIKTLYYKFSPKYLCRIDDTEEIYESVKPFRPQFPKDIEGLVCDMAFFSFLSWAKVINGAKAEIAFVDRFLLSNAAYSAAVLDSLGREDLAQQTINSTLYPLGTNPHAAGTTFFIDCPVDVAHARTGKRARNSFDYGFQSQALEKFKHLAKSAQYPIVTINGARELGEVVTDILSHIKQSIY